MNVKTQDQEVLDCAGRIAKAIGTEKPLIAVKACLMVIQATQLMVNESRLKPAQLERSTKGGEA